MLTPGPTIKPETVRCPSCGTPMSLVGVMPRLGGMAELHTFECKTCDAILTQAANEPPPLGSFPRPGGSRRTAI